MTSYTTLERSTVIHASADSINPFVSDFSRWVVWSPWDGREPDLKRTYGGVQGTVGATYAWDGSGKAGAGTMTATAITPTAVDVELAFTRPFKSCSAVHFSLSEHSGATTVVWTMTIPKTVASRAFGVMMNMEKMIGSDLAKGLSSLKQVVES
ncbi:SRPBCC family protein [Cryobacterium psychrophilum]|uniref:Transcriptional regulator n=1 Tax=Cryobacterium psychrophilum TaxID=41988 RepID=A0A4Y8KN93_9MICO|nr:SRPBCC family protein [Cryobacterium psychrophilum]TDW31111.1 polyketide cyclase/dehydrase/lipid transport protein [Cryobacterium psychrophilum]TFD78591.1 transcriptional regulator [Cryobacterium psychrophilum]